MRELVQALADGYVLPDGYGLPDGYVVPEGDEHPAVVAVSPVFADLLIGPSQYMGLPEIGRAHV